jgi:hypothetical protein
MTPIEYLEAEENYRQERDTLIQRRVELFKEIEHIREDYAREHAPESGLVPGQKVQLNDPFGGGTVTAYFSHAEAKYIHPDGSINLIFRKAKKDGSPSKVIDHSLTQNFKVEG